MISYVLPTRDRADALRATLDSLAALPRHDAQAVIVDNGSACPVSAPRELGNGVVCEVVRLERNIGTAARNVGVARAAALAGEGDDHWVVMLDDDSAPLDARFLGVLAAAPRDVGAIAAEVFLPSVDGATRHEAGGLPEVFIGCGVAIRACDFLALKGYDRAFDYYGEEYDLCAKLILEGMRVVYSSDFAVLHRKVSSGRRMERIVGNLVRNNAWVMARYAPRGERAGAVVEQFTRYARIAWKERCVGGYARGALQGGVGLLWQAQRAMSETQWERFTGLAAAREHIGAEVQRLGVRTVALVEPGKNAACVERAARGVGLVVVNDPSHADALVVGSLSPGVVADAVGRLRATQERPVIAPFRIGTCEWGGGASVRPDLGATEACVPRAIAG